MKLTDTQKVAFTLYRAGHSYCEVNKILGNSKKNYSVFKQLKKIFGVSKLEELRKIVIVGENYSSPNEYS